ncbi:MAG TPA: FAD-dependent monooxygenase [Gemmatimonadales bacterium]|nr:FAD-dependent monooxygenase [Gemmatimonadales bacterium]
MPPDPDVLVVGAGPTGLMLANQLARQGARVRIVDRHAGPARETRALGVQARTLEIYAQLGIAERAVELGKPATGANLWVSGRHVARVPLGDIGRGLSPYPFLLILGQDDNERLLGQRLREQGVEIAWNTELVGLAQEAGRVAVRLRQPDGTVRESGVPWVAGCDGAHSAVRELNGIAFVGAPYQHVFFVADTRSTGPMVPGEVNVFLWPDGFHLFFPLRGADHWRLVGIVPAPLRGRADLDLEDVMPSILHQAGAALSVRSCSWFSTYRIHHRRAERFRDRRCFLLGDAAHIHSPVGAQGMNTGLQDAYNLGWKLGLVATGRAEPALLESYEAERVPVARQLLSTTDRFFSVVVSNQRLAQLLRTRVAPKLLALAMRFERVRRLAFRTISQIGIEYRASPLSETLPGLPAGGPRAGDRFPWIKVARADGAPAEDVYQALDDRGFTLVRVERSGAAPPGGPEPDRPLRTIAIPCGPANDAALARAGLARGADYLVRPDGYIGLCGPRVEPGTVRRYLSERARLTMQPA